VHAAPPPRVALVPNAIAFRDPSRGLLGAGWTSCSTTGSGCRPQGTIQLTGDGGRTWRVVLRTPRPVTAVAFRGRIAWARFDDGENVASADGGRSWHRTVAVEASPAPCPWQRYVGGQVVESAGGRAWALCWGQGSAGNMGKAVFRETARGWRRVAYTPFGPSRVGPGRASGGIDAYGYPVGLAMASDGFGLIWESRGTLYATRDGGSHWTGLPAVAKPEVDFGQSAVALRGGIGWVMLSAGDSLRRRLLETTNAGQSWRVVNSWR
jgi:photosystem II stability/assembly factor-like uncharacterized protein